MQSTNPRDYAGPAAPKPLKPGAHAPNFSLQTTPDQADPADWSPVCGDELTLLNESLPEFQKHNALRRMTEVQPLWFKPCPKNCIGQRPMQREAKIFRKLKNRHTRG
jgi:hypothetical protein